MGAVPRTGDEVSDSRADVDEEADDGSAALSEEFINENWSEGTRDDDADDGDDDEANQLPGATATDVLEYLVKALVEDPDAVVINVDDDRRGVRMQVSVGPGDMGRVIGRRGRIANAIRTVVRAAGAADGVAVDVDFVD